MAEFDEGISMEDASTDTDVNTDTGVDTGVADGVGGDGTSTEDPWSWTSEVGMTPEQVRDSVTNYTKKTQELAKERETLQPYQQLMEELQQDAGLQKAIRDYYDKGVTPDVAIGNLESELRTMQTRIALDDEFKALESIVAEKGLPSFKREEVLQYAVDNDIGSMDSAYKAMKFEEAQSAARASLEADIKKGQSAALPRSGKADGAANERPSVGDIAKMDESSFLDNYESIVKSIVGG